MLVIVSAFKNPFDTAVSSHCQFTRDVLARDYLLEFVYASKMGFLRELSGAIEEEINGKTIMRRILSPLFGWYKYGCYF